jgi:hypothetical protein
MSDSIYLGDGVYAHFDGHHIVLAVNHHENEVVFLERAVMAALVRFADQCFKRKQEDSNV